METLEIILLSLGIIIIATAFNFGNKDTSTYAFSTMDLQSYYGIRGSMSRCNYSWFH